MWQSRQGHRHGSQCRLALTIPHGSASRRACAVASCPLTMICRLPSVVAANARQVLLDAPAWKGKQVQRRVVKERLG